jgi:hypothetical protein
VGTQAQAERHGQRIRSPRRRQDRPGASHVTMSHAVVGWFRMFDERDPTVALQPHPTVGPERSVFRLGSPEREDA